MTDNHRMQRRTGGLFTRMDAQLPVPADPGRSAIEATMTYDRREIIRRFMNGLRIGAVGGLLSFPLPWIVGLVMLNLLWLAHGTAPVDRAHDWTNMTEGGWLAAYFVASVTFASLFASRFSTGPRSIRSDSTLVAATACLVLAAFIVIDGPRYKSEPDFGELLIDKLVLTVPAIIAGLSIAAARSFTSSTTSSPTLPKKAEP